MGNSSEAWFFIYKAFSIAIGVVIVYMGYKLYIKGIMRNAGDLLAKKSGYALELRSAAPGTFFVLLGSLIIIVTVFKGYNSTYKDPLGVIISHSNKAGFDNEDEDLREYRKQVSSSILDLINREINKHETNERRYIDSIIALKNNARQ